MSTQPKTTLICLPYAGGSEYAFRPMEERLGAFAQVKTVALPGRGSRFAEPPVYSLEALATYCWPQIKPWLDKPYALFGHSMGGLLAYLLCHKIKESGLRPPIHLFLSGREAPCVPETEPFDHLLSQEDFKAKLLSYGGIDEAILENEEAFAFFEPAIRADFQAVETWAYQPRPKLDVPATVFAATDDDMTEAEITAWQQEFTADVRFEWFEGGHFFLFEQVEMVAALMRRQMIINILTH